MIIQQVYLPEAGYSIYIKGIKPDNPNKGMIVINGNPTRLERREKYFIENGMVVTENYYFPIEYLLHFLQVNDCIEENEKGEINIIFKEFNYND